MMDVEIEDGTNGGGKNGLRQSLQEQQQQTTTPKAQQAKALRFVTNYGAPHPKRRRIAAACLTCRKRKTACSGERPTCETCMQNKLDCAGYSSEAPQVGNKRVNPHSDEDERPRKTPSSQLKQEENVQPQLQHSHGNNTTLTQPTWPVPDESISTTTHQDAQQSNEITSEGQDNDSLFSGARNRMPYFRWLGPTAIMPGFKQMVVKVKNQEPDLARSSSQGGAVAPNTTSPSSKSLNTNGVDQRVSSLFASTPTALDNDIQTPLTIPFYDTSPMPPSELITHLAQTFFTHLGCNYPFLQRERFMRDLEEKQVDAILVDAVCALAARFSTHSLITQQSSDSNKSSPAEYGHAFAQRAQTALVDTFPCPTVAAVQAALLLAYNEFGENRDSGLWMYLGISIRMAQDLGLHKIEGLKYRGKSGPTPKMIKRESMSGSPELPTRLVSGKREKDETVERAARDKVVKESTEGMVEARDQADAQTEVDEQKAVEQERVDTFWAIFFLDRCVSSGTGRRSTFRDKDIELSFPALDETDPKSGWPAPFPALIRIIHLYGRVADLLNSIKEPSDITWETPKRLASMESQVTNFYQGLSPRLHFDAVNFQHYMKAGEGTNFVLLHFWFHTLIVVLHQPTLLKTFEGRMLQLFPNSQQLSMSSAKTIADILSYSQLMDAKASLGNPFTTQPIYIAACAFLRETAEQTATSNAQSRDSSPSRKNEKMNGSEGRPSSRNRTPTHPKRVSISELAMSEPAAASPPRPTSRSASSMVTEKHKSSDKSEHSSVSAARTASALAKHTLLATAASQHYQLCYKALESLYTYWAGTKYILTVLDQKFEGVRDPLLYTVEEGESAMEQPRPEPAFTSPGWRRKLSWGPYLYGTDVRGADFWRDKAGQMTGSPAGDPSKAIGWTLTGTMNSPNTNLAWHFPSATSGLAQEHDTQRRQRPQHSSGLPGLISMASNSDFAQATPGSEGTQPGAATSGLHPPPTLTNYTNGSSAASHSDMLLGLNSPFTNNGNPNESSDDPFGLQAAPHNDINSSLTNHLPSRTPTTGDDHGFDPWDYNSMWNSEGASMQPFGDMMIESQDVDMSMLGLDMMPWIEPTQDYTGFFDPGQASPADVNGLPTSAGAQAPS